MDSVAFEINNSICEIDDLPKQIDAIFISPHQDDETITLGGGIIDALEEFKGRVLVVLCTDGKASVIRENIGDKKTCKLHKGTHDFKLSKDEFGACRDIEFTNACEALGVPKDHIAFLTPRLGDGALLQEDMEKVIDLLVCGYPDALVCTHVSIGPSEELQNGILADKEKGDTSVEIKTKNVMGTKTPSRNEIRTPSKKIESMRHDKENNTWQFVAQHSDHKAVADAAISLYKQGKIKNLRLFIEPYHLAQFSYAHPDTYIIRQSLASTQTKAIKDALNKYCNWNPENKSYALGQHSVSNLIKFQKDHPCYYSVILPKSEDIEEEISAFKLAITVQERLNLKLKDKLREEREKTSQLRKKKSDLRNSKSWKIGRAITKIPRALKR